MIVLILPDPSGPVQVASVQPIEEGGAQVEEVGRIEGSVEAEKVQAETAEELISCNRVKCK